GAGPDPARRRVRLRDRRSPRHPAHRDAAVTAEALRGRPMTLRLRVALLLQAAALASPITLMGYWSIEPLVTHPVCPVEACNHIAPSFLLPSVLLFAAPLGLLLSYAVKRGAFRRGDLPWLIGGDAYSLALGEVARFLPPLH